MSKNKDMPEKQPITEEKLAELNVIEKRRIERKEQLFMKIMDIPKANWLVEGVAVRDGITLLFGDAGVGKTSLMLQLIACAI